MKTKKTILAVAMILLVIGVAGAATIPFDDWDFKNIYSIFNVSEFTGINFSAVRIWQNGSRVLDETSHMNLSKIDNADFQCPANTSVTNFNASNESVICTTIDSMVTDNWVDITGDTMTGPLITTDLNISSGNITFTGTTPNYIFGGDTTGDDFVICANNVDGKPCLQLDGNAIGYLIAATDIRTQLGDNTGTYEYQVTDSSNNVVASIDSDGNANFEGCVRVDSAGAECSQAESIVADKNITAQNISALDWFFGKINYSDVQNHPAATGDNTSWNESHANTLYLPTGTDDWVNETGDNMSGPLIINDDDAVDDEIMLTIGDSNDLDNLIVWGKIGLGLINPSTYFVIKGAVSPQMILQAVGAGGDAGIQFRAISDGGFDYQNMARIIADAMDGGENQSLLFQINNAANSALENALIIKAGRNIILNGTTTVNDNLTAANITFDNLYQSTNGTEWIMSQHVIDIDDEDIETDLNTYLDVAGDIWSGNQNVSTYNITDEYGNVITGNATCKIIKGSTSTFNIC